MIISEVKSSPLIESTMVIRIKDTWISGLDFGLIEINDMFLKYEHVHNVLSHN